MCRVRNDDPVGQDPTSAPGRDDLAHELPEALEIGIGRQPIDPTSLSPTSWSAPRVGTGPGERCPRQNR
jgi:hypothetical protein